MSRTIRGKVDWADDGKIKFGSPPCDTRIDCIDEDIEGCVIFDGGMLNGVVKVVITAADNPTCNDTYYGCVDWDFGWFEIDIPDECCSTTASPTTTAAPTTTLEYGVCETCETELWEVGEAPFFVTATFTGLTAPDIGGVPQDDCDDYNGAWILQNQFAGSSMCNHITNNSTCWYGYEGPPIYLLAHCIYWLVDDGYTWRSTPGHGNSCLMTSNAAVPAFNHAWGGFSEDFCETSFTNAYDHVFCKKNWENDSGVITW